MGEGLQRIDRRIVQWMSRWSGPAMRGALAVVFIWFGVLKPLGVSPAEPVVLATAAWLPVGEPRTWLAVIGWWEVAIGVTFLFQRTTRIAIVLLAMQMVGTFMPLVLLPHVAFQPGRVPYAPTMEGQYIIKNLVIIAAAIALGGRVRHEPPRRASD